MQQPGAEQFDHPASSQIWNCGWRAEVHAERRRFVCACHPINPSPVCRDRKRGRVHIWPTGHPPCAHGPPCPRHGICAPSPAKPKEQHQEVMRCQVTGFRNLCTDSPAEYRAAFLVGRMWFGPDGFVAEGDRGLLSEEQRAVIGPAAASHQSRSGGLGPAHARRHNGSDVSAIFLARCQQRTTSSRGRAKRSPQCARRRRQRGHQLWDHRPSPCRQRSDGDGR